MIREEQIQEKASELGQKYFPNEHNIWARENIEAKYVEQVFIEGVKWTDENPKRYSQEELCDIQLEMMKQRDKRLLDKVCVWIEEHMNEFCMEAAEASMISWLRKAMEE